MDFNYEPCQDFYQPLPFFVVDIFVVVFFRSEVTLVESCFVAVLRFSYNNACACKWRILILQLSVTDLVSVFPRGRCFHHQILFLSLYLHHGPVRQNYNINTVSEID